MTKSSSIGWIVGVAVGGVGCLGALGAIGVIGAVVWLRTPPDETYAPPIAVEPEATSEVAFCEPPAADEGVTFLFLELGESAFSLLGTDGTRVDLPYEGEAYPFDPLRAELAARRRAEPNRRQLAVRVEDEVPGSIAQRAAEIAREEGIRDAAHCWGGLTDAEDARLREATAAPRTIDGAGSGGGGEGAGEVEGSGEPAEARGRSARPRGARAPARAGRLSREVIRGVIQSHSHEVRACYERGLVRTPDLAGRVTVSLLIGGRGAVESATVASSSLGDAQVERCITQAARRWRFPEPEGGGVVGVNYPFVLTSE